MSQATPHPPRSVSAPDAARHEPRTLYELLGKVTTANPDKAAFRVKREGRWIDLTWSGYRTEVERIARSLLALGIDRGDRVAILGSTRLEWVECDAATVSVGAVTVGIYPSNLAPECADVLGRSGAKLLFAEDEEQLRKILSVRAGLPELRQIVLFDGRADGSGVLSWPDFLEAGRDVGRERLEEAGRRIVPEDLASLVFTSGTTGAPKGAMITHGNLVFAAKAASEALHIEPHYCTLLFLPLAHVYARLIVYMCQHAALVVAFAEGITKVPANLGEARPHFVAGVPRIYEKLHEKIVTTAEEAGGLRRKLFLWAVEIGRQASRRRLAGMPIGPGLAIKHALADRLVLRKVRRVFGGRLAWAVSGAAPLDPRVNEFFLACGVALVQGLGMTENTSLSNTNRLSRNKLGTVGPTVPGVEMKLGDDGEVLFRGPNVMKGYYGDPEATAEVIDADGWLHSGDIGEIDGDGFLTITDRKKDLLITAGGKNVAPQRVEGVLRGSRYISRALACGDRRKFITVLVTLDADNIRAWASRHGLGSKSLEELAREPRVRELIEAEIAERNRELASFESVKRFCILPRELSIEEGDLTPTLKIRRKVVCEKYAGLVERMYGD